MYNLLMQQTKSLEFDPQNPLMSAASLIRSVVFSPGDFYQHFSADGPVREAALFVVLVSVVSSVLGALLSLITGLFGGGITLGNALLALTQAPVFVLLSPIAAGIYLLTIRSFVGVKADFGEVYRMLAYAYAALIVAWVPLLGSFAVTYTLMVLMAVGIGRVYRASLMSAVVAALVGFVPVASGFILIQLLVFKGIF